MSWFAKASREEERGSAEALSNQEALQKKIFISTFAMIAKMASADGSVSKKEVDAVEKFMSEVLSLDKARKQFAIKVFNKARKSDTTFRQHAEDYRALLKDKPEMYEWMVDMLARFSFVDKDFDEGESGILDTACEVFGVPASRYRSLQARLRKAESSGDAGTPQMSTEALQESLALLECSTEDSFEKVQASYEALKARYSPEKIEADGFPEEFLILAKKKLSEITAAFENVSQHFKQQ